MPDFGSVLTESKKNLTSVLIVDDDAAVRESTVRLLEGEGFHPLFEAATAQEAFSLSQRERLSLIILDLGLPDFSGENVLGRIKEENPETLVIVVTAANDLETAIRCMSLGAYDYVVKGSDPSRLTASLRRARELQQKNHELRLLRSRIRSEDLYHPENFDSIITLSEDMHRLFRIAEAAAMIDEPILLQGETGTGKELFAEALHKASGKKGAYVATNLGGLDDFLVSDTLFGHIKGAYTGAEETRKGLAARAENGTLFLDEIGDLSPASQIKLLRFIENKEYYPLGSDLARQSSARIVTASNHDLEVLAQEGKFRKDLYYRLSTYRIDLPPLRERIEDIPLLAHHFLSEKKGESIDELISEEALSLLRAQPFPGNIRQLRNSLLKARVLNGNKRIEAEHVKQVLPLRKSPGKSESKAPAPREAAAGEEALPSIRNAIDTLINEALKRSNGKQNLAAAMLGISPQALNRRLKQRDKNP